VNNMHYQEMGHTHVGAADPCQTKLVTNFAAEQYGVLSHELILRYMSSSSAESS